MAPVSLPLSHMRHALLRTWEHFGAIFFFLVHSAFGCSWAPAFGEDRVEAKVVVS